MNKSIYIHIGHHKTGSTFLQKIFQSNSDVNLLNDFVQPWNDELIKTLISKEDYSVEKVKKVTEQRIIENKVNIISAERLSGHPYSCGYDAELIKSRLFECLQNAKIIIAKREIQSFTLSCYKQIVMEGYCGYLTDFLNPAEWKSVNNRTKYLSQQPLIESYLKSFKEVLILSFEDLVNNENEFLEQISSFINVKLSSNNQQIINSTWNNRRINAMRVLNRFRKSELNQFPIITINYKMLRILSVFLQFFYGKNI